MTSTAAPAHPYREPLPIARRLAGLGASLFLHHYAPHDPRGSQQGMVGASHTAKTPASRMGRSGAVA